MTETLYEDQDFIDIEELKKNQHLEIAMEYIGELFTLTEKFNKLGKAFEMTGNQCAARAIYKISNEADDKLTDLSLFLSKVNIP